MAHRWDAKASMEAHLRHTGKPLVGEGVQGFYSKPQDQPVFTCPNQHQIHLSPHFSGRTPAVPSRKLGSPRN